ncbi:baseplate assembly protein [Myxococcus phage Mx1]|nr:baseplate assembly protein [Myxococcus phage Mx1]
MATTDHPTPIPDETRVPTYGLSHYVQTATIEGSLWDKYLPYQLAIVEAVGAKDNRSYRPTGWRFTLPIPPQELQLSMPVPTQLQATLTGVAIQHGGAPFRDISLMGTTGIAPQKNRGASLSQRSVSESIFAGTVSANDRTKTALRQATEGRDHYPNINLGLSATAGDPDRIPEQSTGYYQMRLMEKFIESYLGMKQRLDTNVAADAGTTDTSLGQYESKNLRLAFCMWKDEAVYLVEPLNFVKKRSASQPMEYTFQLQLRAYKRVQLDVASAGATPHQFVARDPAALSQIFNRFRASRESLRGLRDTLEAIINDPINILDEALRETSLFLAGATGVRATVSDFPKDVRLAVEASVAANWSRLRRNFLSIVDADLDAALTSGRALTESQRKSFENNIATRLTPESVQLPGSTRRKIQTETERVKSLGRADFEAARDLVQKSASDFADRCGAGHPTYSSVFGRSAPEANRSPTNSEMDVLFALNELGILLDHLAASSSINAPVPTSLEYVAGMAEQAGIAFRIPRSKFAVPFPYGTTLEQLALQYLGDANRWHEIVTLNGLRAPYVDETGFTTPLSTNGDRNTINVGSATNLFQGQTVWIVSATTRREKRHVLNVKTITPTSYVVTLDGLPDLHRYTTEDRACIQAFLPGTVNSQQIIYIPSDSEASTDPRTKEVPGVDAFDPLLNIAGIDLLLTQDGDLAITPDGDCKLAYGLTNIVQTVRLVLATRKGQVLHHPEYGLALPVGVSTADVNPEDLIRRAKELFANDPMFSGVRGAAVQKEGPVLRLTLEVGVAGTGQFIPITVAVKS